MTAPPARPPESDEAARHPQDLDPQPFTSTIADRYGALLQDLDPPRRAGIVQQLANGWFDGWHPTPKELQQMIHEQAHESPLRGHLWCRTGGRR